MAKKVKFEPGTKFTQREAVEAAIAAGKDQPSDGVSYIKSRFDLDLSNQAFSTIKSKMKKADTPEAAPTPAATPAPAPVAPPVAAPVAADMVTKADAIRAALKDGIDQPAEGVKYVKAKFGLDITNQQFSTGKFQESKKAGKPSGKPGRQPSVNGAVPHAAARASNPADLVRGLKKLIDAFGADAVRDMTSALAE